MRNYNYQCIFRRGIYTHINRCRLCSLRVGLTVYIPESDTVSVIIMMMVIDLYHDVCVPMSSRWLLISESFLVLTVQDYPKKTLLMRKKIYIFLIQTDTYLSGLACQWIPRASIAIMYGGSPQVLGFWDYCQVELTWNLHFYHEKQ